MSSVLWIWAVFLSGHFVLAQIHLTFYELLDTQNLKTNFNSKSPGEKYDSRQFDVTISLSSSEKNYHLCLDIVNDVVWENLTIDGMLCRYVTPLKGRICAQNATYVTGTLVGHVFHGTIWSNEKTICIEDIRKYQTYMNECPSCHSVMYSTDDIARNKDNIHRYNQLTTPLLDNNDRKKSYERLEGDQGTSTRVGYCNLTALIHLSYLETCTNVLFCIGVIIRHIMKLNEVLNNQINTADMTALQYRLTRVETFGDQHPLSEHLNDPDSLVNEANKYSEHLDTCTTGVYVKRRWHQTLGLSFVGKESGIGICNNHSIYVVSILSGATVLPELTHMTSTVHEVGHTLGSYHDPHDGCIDHCYGSDKFLECAPEHKYVMYHKPIMTNHDNNLMFSPCSVASIKNIVAAPPRTWCLEVSGRFTCGNGKIEDGEECDSGAVKDTCCGSPSSSTPCKLIGQCSPTQGVCCSNTCSFHSYGEICGEHHECKSPTFCSGRSAICQDQVKQEAPKTCNLNTSLCMNEECMGDPCKVFNKSLCECKNTESCQICCRKSENEKCESINNMLTGVKLSRPKGHFCNEFSGACSDNGLCVQQKGFQRLIGLLLQSGSSECMVNVKTSVKEYSLFIFSGSFILTFFACNYCAVKKRMTLRGLRT